MFPLLRPKSASTSVFLGLLALVLLGAPFWQPAPLHFFPKQLAFSKPPNFFSLTAWQVEASGAFTHPILQQPDDNAVFVTNRRNSLTQFHLPAHDGITGVLAHNYLSGQDFYKLHVGQSVRVLYDNQKIGYYKITSIHRYQKLKPSSLQSDLLDLETNQKLSTPEVYKLYYRGRHHLIFQTCLEGEGRLDWGLLFVVAEPVIE